jgi:hypothetical protein
MIENQTQLSYEDEFNVTTFAPLKEKDPTGKRQNEKGSKVDKGKPRMDLVLGGFAEALIEVSKVGTFGANKYVDNGWQEVPNGEQRYTDALLRHYFYERQGESIDPDSNLLHASHTAWNALARLSFILKEKNVNTTGT